MTAPAVKRYRKRPVEVEAIQWTGTNLAEVLEFAGGACFDAVPPEDRGEDPDMTAEVYDKLHSTWVHVYDGQWIIRGVRGELYPCASDVFAETYEPAGGVSQDDGDAPDEITRLRAELEHARAALAGDNEGIRLWMIDCGLLVEKHRKAAAEAVTAERECIAQHMEALAANYPEDVFRPEGTSRDAIGGNAMRHAYTNAARAIRVGERES